MYKVCYANYINFVIATYTLPSYSYVAMWLPGSLWMCLM